MKPLFDLHTHTIASGHAYSTIQENIQYAYELGLRAYGFSDHGPAIEGGPSELYFQHFRVLPREYRGMKVCCGIEANICDFEGRLDIGEKTMSRVDYIIASLHSWCLRPGDVGQNMRAYLGAMKNPCVKIIGHPDDSAYPLDYEELVKQALRHGVALELNESSLDPASVRTGVRENLLTMLSFCERFGCPVLCGTDAHHCSYIGNFARSIELMETARFPEELVLNLRMEGLEQVLNQK